MLRNIRRQINRMRVVGFRNWVRLNTAKKGTLIHFSDGDSNITVRARTPDLSVAIHSLGDEFELLRPLLARDFDGLIIDGGGYIGTAAIAFSRMFPMATIVCVEPSSHNLRMITLNTEAFQNIKILHAALHSEDGIKISLMDPGRREWGFSIVDEKGSDGAASHNHRVMETVDTISIPSIIKKLGLKVGIVKLDIEGAERDIFASAAFMKADIPVVIVELHETIAPGCLAAFEAFSNHRTIVKSSSEKFLSIAKKSQAT
jgi:FkbM family methyltransferase